MPALVLAFVLVLARVATFIAVLPVLSGRTVPRLIKTSLAVALTAIWFSPAIMAAPPESLLRQEYVGNWLPIGLAVAREIILGGLLGYVFGLFIVPARVAGEFISQEMGLTFGQLLDPTSANPTGPLTQIFEIIAIVLFFGLDGHHVLLAVFQSTLVNHPIGKALPEMPIQHLLDGMVVTEEWGLSLAAPVAVILFLMTVILAILTRSAPQLNLYSIGFPLRLAAGLLAMLLLLPNLLHGILASLGRFGEMLTWLQ